MPLPVGNCTQCIGKKRDVGVFTGNRRLKCSFSKKKVRSLKVRKGHGNDGGALFIQMFAD